MLHNQKNESLIVTKPFAMPSPSRTVAIAWRKHYPRKEAIYTVRDTIQNSPLEGVDIIRSVA
jgi:LysR family hydrogen peroxide-inducible transcriptional activator